MGEVLEVGGVLVVRDPAACGVGVEVDAVEAVALGGLGVVVFGCGEDGGAEFFDGFFEVRVVAVCVAVDDVVGGCSDALVARGGFALFVAQALLVWLGGVNGPTPPRWW